MKSPQTRGLLLKSEQRYDFEGCNTNDKQVKRRAITGEKPAKIQSDLIANAQEKGLPISTKTVPTKNLIACMAHLSKRRTRFSPDAIQNILMKHTSEGTDFCRQVHFYPIQSFVFATPTGLCLLEQNPDCILLDGTFDFCELGLILTTWMVRIDDIAFPCAWFLSDSQTAETYAHAFQSIRDSAPKFNPKAFLGDFEPALRKATSMTFPYANFYGDGFHFVYNNQQKLTSELAGRADAKSLKKQITFELRLLYNQTSQTEFYKRLDSFLAKYGNPHEFPQLAGYMNYFKNQWLQGTSEYFSAYFYSCTTRDLGDVLSTSWHSQW